MANTTPQLSIIQGSTIGDRNVGRASIRRCTLNNIEIKTSTIFGSILNNCRLFNCTLKRCSVTNSSLYETQVQHCSMEKCESTTALLDLRKFAPEIREQIFQRCIHASSNWSPEILVALRSDPDLYHEALRVFYRLNYFEVMGSTVLSCDLISDKCVEGIRNLYLSWKYIENAFPERLLGAPIENLHLQAYLKDSVLSFSQNVLNSFPNLKALIFTMPLYRTDFDSADPSWRFAPRFRNLHEVIQITNDHLGITGRLYRVQSGGSSSEHWLWEAPKGKNLKWVI